MFPGFKKKKSPTIETWVEDMDRYFTVDQNMPAVFV